MNELGPDIETPQLPDIERDDDMSQPPDAELPDQAEIDQDQTTGSLAPQLDVYGQPDQEGIEQQHLVRRTRSGRSYNSMTDALLLHSIFKSVLKKHSAVEQLAYKRALAQAQAHNLPVTWAPSTRPHNTWACSY